MASPFSVFRKRQKLMMALLCLMAMIAFVILPNISDMMGGGKSQQKDAVVVKTKAFGNLRRSDIDRMRWNKQKVLSVLTGTLEDAIQRMGGGAVQVAAAVRADFGSTSEEDLVATWLKLQHGRKMGIVVSDEAVNNFLRQWTNNQLERKDFHNAIQRSPPVPDEYFFDLMRDELLAREVKMSFQVSQLATTLGQRWNAFNRLKRQAIIEAAPLPVARFLKAEDKPTDEELKQFFLQHKGAPADSESGEPGFRKPQEVALEYFRIDVDTLATPEFISDEEVQRRYEKYQPDYDRLFAQGEAKEEDLSATPTETEKEPLRAKHPKTEPKKQPKSELKRQPKTQPKEQPKTEPKKAPKTESQPRDKGTVSEHTSFPEQASPFSLVSLLQAADEKSPPPGAKPAAAAKEHSQPAAEHKPVKKPEEPAAEHKPVKILKMPAAEQKSAGAEKKTEKPKTVLTEAMKRRIRRDIALYEKIGPLFGRLCKPMDAYQSQRSIYDAKVIQQAGSKGAATLGPPPPSPNFKKLAEKELTIAGADLFAPLSPRARVTPWLSVGRTELLSKRELEAVVRKAALSADSVAPENRRGNDWETATIAVSLVGNRVPLLHYAYESMTPLEHTVMVPFQHTESINFEPYYKADGLKCDDPLCPKDKLEHLPSNVYLLWMVEDVKESAPKLGDPGVRQEAIGWWQQLRARQAAEKEAESLAGKAKVARVSLKQVFSDIQVVTPPPFTWMSFKNAQFEFDPSRQAATSLAPGIEMPGEEFMKTVFRLDPGQVGVAFNAPRTVVYVIRPSNFIPPYDDRWQQFKVEKATEFDRNGKYYSAGIEQAKMHIEDAWLKELKDSAGFEWGEGHHKAETTEEEKPTPEEEKPTPEED
jgi:hypothetical protein